MIKVDHGHHNVSRHHVAYLDVFGVLHSRKSRHVRIAFNEAWMTFVQTSICGWSLSLPVANCDALNLKINCTHAILAYEYIYDLGDHSRLQL